jgi:hypothetical protein
LQLHTTEKKLKAKRLQSQISFAQQNEKQKIIHTKTKYVDECMKSIGDIVVVYYNDDKCYWYGKKKFNAPYYLDVIGTSLLPIKGQ